MSIKIEILGDDKSIRQAFGNVEGGLGRLTGPLAAMGTAIAGAFAIDKLAGFGGEIIGLATDLGNIENKVKTVFGGMSDEVATWADGLGQVSTDAALLDLADASIRDRVARWVAGRVGRRFAPGMVGFARGKARGNHG